MTSLKLIKMDDAPVFQTDQNFDVDLRTTFTRACTFRQCSQLLDINDIIKERGVAVDIRSIIVHNIRLGGDCFSIGFAVSCPRFRLFLSYS